MGGNRVNDEFIHQFETVFTKSFVEKFQKECPTEWLTILNDIELKKREVSKSKDETINITLPYSFNEQCKTRTGKNIESALEECDIPGVRYFQSCVQFSAEKSRAMFRQVVGEIVDHIKHLTARPQLTGVKYIFMVGGFSSSPMLYNTIKDKFDKRFQVIIPEDAELSIVKGAVIFGHHPEIITSRKSKLTYGIATINRFIDGFHPEEKRIKINGVEHCDDIFCIFVKEGEDVPHGFSTEEIPFSPLYDDQSKFLVNIYSSESVDVKYTTDDGCEELGEILIDWEGSGQNRKAEVKMVFGGTEIRVEVTTFDEKRGKTRFKEMPVNFLPSGSGT